MNKKGFTLVELLAVLVVLGIVVGITIPSINGVMNSSRQKSEESFIETIKDAMDIYISSSAKSVTTYSECPVNTPGYDFYEKATITFQDVIDSPYRPINAASLFNPGNEKKCSENVTITLYRNKNYVYYYVINKNDFKVPGTSDSCFKYTIEDPDAENYDLYISNMNMEDPGNPPC